MKVCEIKCCNCNNSGKLSTDFMENLYFQCDNPECEFNIEIMIDGDGMRELEE